MIQSILAACQRESALQGLEQRLGGHTLKNLEATLKELDLTFGYQLLKVWDLDSFLDEIMLKRLMYMARTFPTGLFVACLA